jgi:alpha-L-fucosidase
MKKAMFVLSVSMMIAFSPVLLSPVRGETTDQRDARMQWWRQARFGMFVHWGLYSGLAGTWEGKPVGKRGGMEWIQQRVRVDTWEYAHEAVPHFRPKEGFADDWAKLARQAGCQYVVFTTKHHDGFCLFNSQYTTYDAHDLIGRDLCKEIVDAVRSEGLNVGFYHSVIDWHHPQESCASIVPICSPIPTERRCRPKRNRIP